MAGKGIDSSALLEGLDDIVADNNSESPKRELKYDIPAEQVLSKGSMGEGPDDDVKRNRTFVLDINPKLCRPWKYADRFDEWFTPENCADIIETLPTKGQKFPGVVRPLENDPDGFKFEVIVGRRRHFSASYVTDQSDETFHFKAYSMSISDEEAAILMDFENDKHADISEFERCVSYRRQVGKVPGYDAIFNTAEELRESLLSHKEIELTKAGLSQKIAAGKLNEIQKLIKLFAGYRNHISYTHAYHLVKAYDSSDDARKAILSTAKGLKPAAESSDVDVILKSLILATKEKAKPKKAKPYTKSYSNSNGITVLDMTIKPKMVDLNLPLTCLDECSDTEILRHMKEALKEIRGKVK